jgi:hypothetical protein
MRHIEIVRKQGNLTQEQWQFFYNDSRHVLVLINYQSLNRPTTRHKFRTVEHWDAYRDRRHNYDGEKLEDVPLPDDVTAEALQVFTTSLRVVKGFER